MYPPTSTSEEMSRSLLPFSLMSIWGMFPRRETAARRRGVVYMNREGSVWMKRLAPLRGYPAPREGASPAWRRGLLCPSLQVTGEERLVKPGMLRPFTSVVTVLSNVVSNVLSSERRTDQLLSAEKERPTQKTKKAHGKWQSLVRDLLWNGTHAFPMPNCLLGHRLCNVVTQEN